MNSTRDQERMHPQDIISPSHTRCYTYALTGLVGCTHSLISIHIHHLIHTT